MLSHKAIDTPPRHRFPKSEELKGRHYCKWHNSSNHTTNNCVVLRDVVQEALALRKLKIAKKVPTIDTIPFPKTQINMVNLNWPKKDVNAAFLS